MVNVISILTALLTLTAGIGVFLVACTMMSSNLESAASRRLKQLFSHTGNNKLVGVGIGTLGTAAIQSSGAVTVMVIGFVNVGIMSLTQAATIIYGANIGTTVTPQLQLAMFHTVFNVTTMLVALPLTNALVNLACRIIKDQPAQQSDEPHLYFLDPQMLRTPVVAIRQLKEEIENMANMAIENYQRAIRDVTTLDDSERDEFNRTERQLNYLNRELVHYALLLSNSQLSEFDHQYLVSTIRTVSDLERIGDYAKNIVEYADSLRQMWSKARLVDGFTSEYFDAYIDSMATIMDKTQDLNFKRWDMLNAWLPFTTGIRGSYQGEIDFLKTTIAERLEWMDNRIGIDSTLLGVANIPLQQTRIKAGKCTVNISGMTGNEHVEIYSLDGSLIIRRKPDGFPYHGEGIAQLMHGRGQEPGSTFASVHEIIPCYPFRPRPGRSSRPRPQRGGTH